MCGAHRIGHGCRLREDGDLLHYVVDHRIPLECCPSSNVQTGAIASLETHPLRLYKNLGARVTINTDNRLITDTTVSNELWLAHSKIGLTFSDIKQIVLNGFKSAFLPFHEKQRYLSAVSKQLEAVSRRWQHRRGHARGRSRGAGATLASRAPGAHARRMNQANESANESDE